MHTANILDVRLILDGVYQLIKGKSRNMVSLFVRQGNNANRMRKINHAELDKCTQPAAQAASGHSGG